MFITTALLATGAALLGKKTHDRLTKKKTLVHVLATPVMEGGLVPISFAPYLPEPIKPFLTEPSINEEEKEVNHYLAISIIATGLAGLGSLTFPILTVISLPLSIYTFLPIFNFPNFECKVTLKVDHLPASGLQ